MVATNLYNKRRLAVMYRQVCRCGMHLASWRWNQQVSAAFLYMSARLCGITSWKRLPYFPAHKTHFFFPKNVTYNSTCVLCTEGKYYFQTYKYLCVYYTTSLSWDSENTMKMILVAVTTIFWVSMMNKLYYGC